MSYSISATPAAAAASTTQQPSQSSDVTITYGSVDTWLTDERAPLCEKGNLNSLRPQDSLVLHILLSAIGIDETRLEQALAEETVWMQLRENLISRINDVVFFWMNCWGLALLLVFFTSPATFPFNCPLAAPLDPDDMAVDWRTPFPYAFASFLFLVWSFLVSKMWLLALVNFPASSLRECCRRNATRLTFFFFLALPTYLWVAAVTSFALAVVVVIYLASSSLVRILGFINLARVFYTCSRFGFT